MSMAAGTLPEGFSDPVGYTLESVSDAPQSAGVHLVIGDNGEVIYVGKTGDLRRRLREHLQGDRQASVLHEQVGDMLDSEQSLGRQGRDPTVVGALHRGMA